jgi:hypothetical protein
MKINQAYYSPKHSTQEWRCLPEGKRWPEQPVKGFEAAHYVSALMEYEAAKLEYLEALTSALDRSKPFEDQERIANLVCNVNGVEAFEGVTKLGPCKKEGLYTIPPIEVKFVKMCDGCRNDYYCMNCDNEVTVARIVSQSSERKVKSLQECKDEVAKKYGYTDFQTMDRKIGLYLLIDADEAAELYASQFKSEPVEERKEDIIALLTECDDLLCMIEDYEHGRTGKWITDLRGKIQKFIKVRSILSKAKPKE